MARPESSGTPQIVSAVAECDGEVGLVGIEQRSGQLGRHRIVLRADDRGLAGRGEQRIADAEEMPEALGRSRQQRPDLGDDRLRVPLELGLAVRARQAHEQAGERRVAASVGLSSNSRGRATSSSASCAVSKNAPSGAPKRSTPAARGGAPRRRWR